MDDQKKQEVEHFDGTEEASYAGPAPATPFSKTHDETEAIAEANKDLTWEYEEERKVLRMIDWRVTTMLCMVYLLQQLDKSSLGYAAVFSLQAETHLVGTEYSWLTSAVYVTQLICQPLSAYGVIHFPMSKWIFFNIFSWSIVVMCTAAAKSFVPLLICRILLGGFEATLAPSFVAVNQQWFTREEQSWRNTFWNLSNSLAGVVGPALSYGVGSVKNSIKPYQGIFLCLGAISLICAPLVYFILPDSATTAKFLSNGNDRAIAIERMRANNTGVKSREWSWPQFWETMGDPKTYLFAMTFFLCAAPSGGFGAFSGLVIKGFGFTSLQTIAYQIPQGAIPLVCLPLAMWGTQKVKMRWPFIAFLTLIPIGGAIGLKYMDPSKVYAKLGMVYLVSNLAVLQPLMYAWSNLNASGQTKKVTTTAILFVFQCVGNIAGPQVFFTREAPVYSTGFWFCIGCWSTLFVLVIFIGQYLGWLNRRNSKRRLALGMIGDVVDVSIMGAKEAYAYNAQVKAEQLESGVTKKINEDAFKDLTDLQKVDFIYVI